MGENARSLEETLSSAEAALAQFRAFIPNFSQRFEPGISSAMSNLLPQIELLLGNIAEEKSKAALLAARFLRNTLNIGVAGRARQGKGFFLQKLTGLSDVEIPTGQDGHCTGAPSTIFHRDIDEPYAEIQLHTEESFLENVVWPFFQRLQLGTSPRSLQEFAQIALPSSPPPESIDPTTDAAFLDKLAFLHRNLDILRPYLTGSLKTVPRMEIRDWIAQDDSQGKRKDTSGRDICRWATVFIAYIYCRFPQTDLGAISVSDTPGIGDFVSGAEHRLMELIGRNLDAILFVRKPEPIGALVKPEDTALHSVVVRAIPELPVDAWSYYLVNRICTSKENNESQIPSYLSQLSGRIHTRATKVIDFSNDSDVAAEFDEILSDISSNLTALDGILLSRRREALTGLVAQLNPFIHTAKNLLPKASAVAPDHHKLLQLFNGLWNRLCFSLESIVSQHRELRSEPDQGFLEKVDSIFETLEAGPRLPSDEVIAHESAGPGLAAWHAEAIHKQRVELASAFDAIDDCLQASFGDLRTHLIEVLRADDAGKLNAVLAEYSGPWEGLEDLWKGHADAEHVVSAIKLLLSSTLSFRGFIQPRVRAALDVLDSGCEEARDFAHVPGDSIPQVREKLEMAWMKAVSDCRHPMDKMAVEPAMARFAAAQDFVDSIIRSGGAQTAKERWYLFYQELRSEIWSEEFTLLEEETRLRKQWNSQILVLEGVASSLQSF